MEPIDSELKKGLAGPPLSRDGFTERLRRQIEEHIDQQSAPRRRIGKRWLGSIGASAVVLSALLIIGLGQQASAPWQGFLPSSAGMHSAKQQTPAAAETAQQPYKAALLLGLRTDKQQPGGDTPTSAYRTLLIAPDGPRLSKVAEGSGILMPYKMDFWRLEEQRYPGKTGDSVVLTAARADVQPQKPRSETAPAAPEGTPYRLNEKLRFVGNRYIAIEQTAQWGSGPSASVSDYVWVKEITQLVDPKHNGGMPMFEPHVALKDVQDKNGQALSRLLTQDPLFALSQSQATKQSASGEAGESWSLVRDKGEWQAQVAVYNNTVDAAGKSGYRLIDVPGRLPESVVAYDTLTPAWEEIAAKQPLAVDAYSSPDRSLVAVLTDRNIIVYPYKDELITSPLLTVPLQPGEHVIMAHWAIDNYVDNWKKQAGQLLAKR